MLSVLVLTLTIKACDGGYPKVPEDFKITEKAPTRAFSWSASRRFQPKEDPSRGLLRDFEIFVNLCLTFVCSSSDVTRASQHQEAGPRTAAASRDTQAVLSRAARSSDSAGWYLARFSGDVKMHIKMSLFILYHRLEHPKL